MVDVPGFDVFGIGHCDLGEEFCVCVFFVYYLCCFPKVGFVKIWLASSWIGNEMGISI